MFLDMRTAPVIWITVSHFPHITDRTDPVVHLGLAEQISDMPVLQLCLLRKYSDFFIINRVNLSVEIVNKLSLF